MRTGAIRCSRGLGQVDNMDAAWSHPFGSSVTEVGSVVGMPRVGDALSTIRSRFEYVGSNRRYQQYSYGREDICPDTVTNLCMIESLRLNAIVLTSAPSAMPRAVCQRPMRQSRYANASLPSFRCVMFVASHVLVAAAMHSNALVLLENCALRLSAVRSGALVEADHAAGGFRPQPSHQPHAYTNARRAAAPPTPRIGRSAMSPNGVPLVDLSAPWRSALVFVGAFGLAAERAGIEVRQRMIEARDA